MPETGQSTSLPSLAGQTWLARAQTVMWALGNAGFEARAVGGAVRNALMKLPVGDVDLIWKRDFTRFENKAPERYSEFDSYNAEGGGGF